MLKSERKQRILDRIQEEQFVRLEELVGDLQTSESTVRRDLDELEAAGQLQRVHGGAQSLPNLLSEESIEQKSVKNVQTKQELVTVALDKIQAGDVVFIDAGTTTELLVAALTSTDITVVTNSIHHATKLVDKNIPTLIIGGVVKQSTDASIGALAVQQIRSLNFDKAFLGMNGVDGHYFTTPDLEEALIKRTVLENTTDAYVLVDASKIAQKSFAKVAEVHQATIVTNRSASGLLEKIKEKTKVIEV